MLFSTTSTMSSPKPAPGEVTRLLASLKQGDQDAANRLLPLVYDELRQLAASYMRRERPDHTLQATALVNEAFVRMVGKDATAFDSRSHFFGVAAGVMRHILVDHARSRAANKRGGSAKRLPLDEALVFSDQESDQLLALDEALDKLAKLSPRQAKIIELRFFTGLSIPETASILGVARRTVVREWTVAQAWLQRELNG
jgi:RNA polymerase sigma factor (TIGR02999 family)